jgi:outer membrane protein assembly factor BamA
MRVLFFALLVATSLLRADDDPDQNVNSKYTVESVDLLPSSAAKRAGSGIKSAMNAMVGQKLDQDAIDKLSNRIAGELHRKVKHRVEKGTQPEHVKVVYDAPRSIEADADVTKLAYTSKEGFTGALQTNFDLAGLRVRAGVQSDADHLLERYAGYNLGASRSIGERVRIGLDFESFHQQWNATTVRALEERTDVSGIYRERYHVMPTVSVLLAEPLTVTFGIDIQHFQTQFPAARFEASNAVTTTLRYRRRWSSDASRQEVDAGYGLRAATRTVGSDYVYTRHAITAEYRGKVGESVFSARFLAGALIGEAPLFERFTLGDSRTLRGWSKFDIAPLGGTRVAHGSLDYTFHWIGVFYDTGTVWERRQNSNVKHSAGIALGGREGFYVAVAFPLRSGSVQPLFILGMNF